MDFRKDVRDKGCQRGSLVAEAVAAERCSHNRSCEREKESMCVHLCIGMACSYAM